MWFSRRVLGDDQLPLTSAGCFGNKFGCRLEASARAKFTVVENLEATAAADEPGIPGRPLGDDPAAVVVRVANAVATPLRQRQDFADC